MKTTKKETMRSNRQDTGLEHCAHHSKHWDDEQEIRLKMFKIIKNGKRGEK